MGVRSQWLARRYARLSPTCQVGGSTASSHTRVQALRTEVWMCERRYSASHTLNPPLPEYTVTPSPCTHAPHIHKLYPLSTHTCTATPLPIHPHTPVQRPPPRGEALVYPVRVAQVGEVQKARPGQVNQKQRGVLLLGRRRRGGRRGCGGRFPHFLPGLSQEALDQAGRLVIRAWALPRV